MQIAIASGKGGTGKTLVATNLASYLNRLKNQTTYLDCDVEAPNGHLFLKPVFEQTTQIGIPVPHIDEQKCNHCGQCKELCQFNAIAALPDNMLIFTELCHGCGGCWMVCPSDAITPFQKPIGNINKGYASGILCVQGVLDIGQPLSPPVIHAVRQEAPQKGITIIDAPPGASCPVIESIRHADYTVLVTESSPFGLNDLKLAVEMVQALHQPFGIVINRAGNGFDDTEVYIRDNRFDFLGSIKEDRNISETYSMGKLAVDACPGFKDELAGLYINISESQKRYERTGCN